MGLSQKKIRINHSIVYFLKIMHMLSGLLLHQVDIGVWPMFNLLYPTHVKRMDGYTNWWTEWRDLNRRWTPSLHNGWSINQASLDRQHMRCWAIAVAPRRPSSSSETLKSRRLGPGSKGYIESTTHPPSLTLAFACIHIHILQDLIDQHANCHSHAAAVCPKS